MPTAFVPTHKERAKATGRAWPVVIALDLGTNMGVAIQHVDGRIAHAVQVFEKGGHPGARFRAFRRWLTRTHQSSGGFQKVLYEKVQFSGENVQTQHAAQLYGAWEGHLLEWCCLYGIDKDDIEPVAVATLKKFATGSGRAKRDDVAPALEAMGYHPRNHDEAHALALLLLGLERIGGRPKRAGGGDGAE